MHRLALITPSYGPDAPLVHDLHASVLAFTEPDVVHHLVVPRRDAALFAGLRGPRCRIWCEEDLLARHIVPAGWLNAVWQRLPIAASTTRIAAVNLRRPYPPIRGWVMQQLLKIEIAPRVGADVVLFLDSDVVLARPVSTPTFVRDGAVRLYRKEEAVDDGLPRHLAWHAVARRLLGLPPASAPLPDYVSSFLPWDAALVTALRRRIEDVHGRPWMDVVGAEADVSEWTLYGVFVDEVVGGAAASFVSDETLCHSYWDPVPLGAAAAHAFVEKIGTRDVAVLIQSKSGTALDVRRDALASLRS